ncbi:MAG: ATP-binding protein [bacterium]|nr:ATP-binding protein [bacterium]MDI1335736.1 ATP-binding protein [Lacunisphaera sp.]
MKPPIPRDSVAAAVRRALTKNPVVALLGPRQCGKSTLARQIAAGSRRPTFLDLENPADLAVLAEPMQALAGFRGLVVLDEVQRRPELFPVLRVLADRQPLPARFLVLGSASVDLLQQSSETLAGRMAFIDLAGFTLAEVGPAQLERLWRRGGFPRSFLAASEAQSAGWRADFVRTFVERDLGQLGFNLPAAAVQRFWTMLAHYHGQTWNASELGRSLGVSDQTTRTYLDALTGALFVRQLAPWFENVGKRQTKAPKIYIRDSGIFHTLMGLADRRALLSHPKLGASWEGFAVEEVLARFPTRDAYFWATHAGAELDLLLLRNGRRIGFEFKFTDTPTTTKSMRIALADLKLDHLWVVHPGVHRHPLAERIEAIGLAELVTSDEALA